MKNYNAILILLLLSASNFLSGAAEQKKSRFRLFKSQKAQPKSPEETLKEAEFSAAQQMAELKLLKANIDKVILDADFNKTAQQGKTVEQAVKNLSIFTLNSFIKNGQTPLTYTISLAGKDAPAYLKETIANIVDKLLIKHADPDRSNQFGKTPLHAAVEMLNDKAVKRLLQDASANLKDKDGKTPLHYIFKIFADENLERDDLTKTKHYLPAAAIAQYLFKRKADSEITDNEGKTPWNYLLLAPTINNTLLNIMDGILIIEDKDGLREIDTRTETRS